MKKSIISVVLFVVLLAAFNVLMAQSQPCAPTSPQYPWCPEIPPAPLPTPTPTGPHGQSMPMTYCFECHAFLPAGPQ